MERTVNPQFDAEQKTLIEAIYSKYNYDFRHYEPASLKRTLVYAMNRMGCLTLAELQKKALHGPECFIDLIQSLTIPVSEMFRDPLYFRALREKVVPHLKTYPSIKIWVAGCSTGEEAYSLAILLHEEGLLERAALYATDINARGLEKAERGVLGLDVIQKFTRNYQESGGKCPLTDYCAIGPAVATLNSVLKEKITFTDHSLVTDAVFLETQLISCRNVLIYFDRQFQDRALGLFYESLCRKGFLGLGLQETVQFSKYGRYFEPFMKKGRIFQKKD